MDTWASDYEKWYNENKHLPNIKKTSEVLKIIEDRKNQLNSQMKIDSVDTKLEVTQLRTEVNEVKAQLDSIIRHFNVPHTPLWKRRQEQKNND